MKTKNLIVKGLFNVLLETGFEDSYILDVEQKDFVLSAWIKLPPKKELSHLLEILPNLKQEVNAQDAKIGKVDGKKVEILFGKRDLSHVPFKVRYLNKNSLKLTVVSSFGEQQIDFSDGASCHLLNGGAPRMGKTIFLLYLSTALYVQTKGKMKLFINSPKSKDFYPFFGLPNVKIERDQENIIKALDIMIDEYKRRNNILYSTGCLKATDAKSIKERYPHMYKHFTPMFLIIDEYGRFATVPEIQKKVMELVETAGFVNVHVIIATQRPDAKSVLPPRIKQGLQARICFRVPDKNNSIVILDQEGAETLPKDKGRALLLDGDITQVQVPYLTYEQAERLLRPFRKEVTHDLHESTEGSENNELTEKIQSLFKESTSPHNFPIEQQSYKRHQSNYAEDGSGWFRLASKKGER